MNPEENKPKSEERVPIKSLRTYQGDVQEAISKNKYTSTTILVSEQKRKLEAPVDEVVVKKYDIRNKSFVVFGIAFIAIGIALVSALYYLKAHEEVVIEQKTKAIIAYNEEQKINQMNLNREDLVSKIVESKTSWNATVNSVLYLNILDKNLEASAENVISTIAPNMPPSLVRSFGDEYMFGIYSFDTNEPFIILTVDDYAIAYSGMLKWELDAGKDLSTLFNIPAQNSSTTLVFKDETAKNKDMRVLKDSAGAPLVLYSFIDRKTLVITKNENVLSAIVGKFLINKQTK